MQFMSEGTRVCHSDYSVKAHVIKANTHLYRNAQLAKLV
jgi:hypothetical protein